MVTDRGAHEEIDVLPGFPLNNKLSGNVVDLCPVGALGDKDFLYQQRVWFMRRHAGVCTGCSTGCSIWIEENQDRIYRIKPRENPFVALVAAETPVCIFGKSWLLHVREVLQATPEENLAMVADSVAFAGGGRPRDGLRRRALLRRLQGRSRPTPWPRCGPPATPAPRRWSCARPTAAR